MKITTKLKDHLVKNFGLAATASDDDARKIASEKMASGQLTVDQFAELTKPDDATAKLKGLVGDMVKEQIAPLTAGLDSLATLIKGKLGGDGAALVPGSTSISDISGRKAFGGSGVTGSLITAANSDVSLTGGTKADGSPASGRTALMGGDGTGTTGVGAPRVKNPLEGYSNAKSAATYDHSKNTYLKSMFGGQPVRSAKDGEGARALDFASQADKAVAGSFWKYAVLCAPNMTGQPVPAKFALTEHDEQILNYALNELPWTGMIGYNETSDQAKSTVGARKLHDWERKALLDDVLSGGLQAAPIAFDDAVIIQPLLNGQLFPRVNLVNVTRGRRIEAFSIGNPTFTWGIAEGTNIPIFDTDAFIAAFDNNIYNATGSLPLGIDFEEDSPNNIGDIVTERYGQAALTTLDNVIAVGDGVTQPQGVANASGTTTIVTTNGTGGPPTLADFVGLQFGLPLQYRQPRSVYLTNDVSYQRSRNLTVDQSGTTDERRLLGMNMQEYRTIGYDHTINASVPNSTQIFFDPGRYRMYRRLGLQIRIETAGQTLALLNERLIVCRMRMGGALELGAAAAVSTDAQS